MQRLFVLVWASQIGALFYMITFLELITNGGVPTRMRIVGAIIAFFVQFGGLVYLWLQQATISDLEYRQAILPETMAAALKKEVK